MLHLDERVLVIRGSLAQAAKAVVDVRVDAKDHSRRGLGPLELLEGEMTAYVAQLLCLFRLESVELGVKARLDLIELDLEDGSDGSEEEDGEDGEDSHGNAD